MGPAAALPAWIWALIIPAPLLIFLLEEGRKALVRRGCSRLAA